MLAWLDEWTEQLVERLTIHVRKVEADLVSQLDI
jgi:hypothetical protein